MFPQQQKVLVLKLTEKTRENMKTIWKKRHDLMNFTTAQLEVTLGLGLLDSAHKRFSPSSFFVLDTLSPNNTHEDWKSIRHNVISFVGENTTFSSCASVMTVLGILRVKRQMFLKGLQASSEEVRSSKKCENHFSTVSTNLAVNPLKKLPVNCGNSWNPLRLVFISL